MAKKQSIPPWVWIGCGCVLFPLVVIAVLGGLGVFAFNFFEDAIDTMADPTKREEAGKAMLGAESMPAGYHVRAILRFPLAFDMAVIGDGTPPAAIAGEKLEDKARSFENIDLASSDDRRFFLFVLLKQKSEQTIDELLSGTGGGGLRMDLGVRFRSDEDLGRGDLQIRGQRVAWLARRGSVAPHGGAVQPGVYTEMTFDCPDKQRRLGLLFHKTSPVATEAAASAVEAAPAAPGDFAGTPADPVYLETFLNHFDVCK
jgi:hypothetical protein